MHASWFVLRHKATNAEMVFICNTLPPSPLRKKIQNVHKVFCSIGRRTLTELHCCTMPSARSSRRDRQRMSTWKVNGRVRNVHRGLLHAVNFVMIFFFLIFIFVFTLTDEALEYQVNHG